MAVTAFQDLTLRLPTELVERIKQTADYRHQSPTEVVTEVLTVSVPPLRRRLEPPLESLVAGLETLPAEEIQRRATQWFPEREQQRLSELLERNRTTTLTLEENEEIEKLLDLVQQRAMESAAAKWLLSAQDCPVSPNP